MNANAMLVRCDGGPEIGTGHVMRCMALAAALREHGANPVFALGLDSVAARAALLSAGFDVVGTGTSGLKLGDGDADRVVALCHVRGIADVFIDHYGAGRAYVERLQRAGLRVGALDDFADQDIANAHWLLNYNVEAKPAAYPSRMDARDLLGPAYAPLRAAFARVRATLAREFRKTDSRVLVTFGGGAAAGRHAAEVVASLAACNRSIDVVCAVPNPAPQLPEGVRVPEPGTEIADLMAWADVSINAGGTTTYELCALGVPSVIVTIAENQRPNARAFARAGAAIDCGAFDDSTLATAVSNACELLRAPERREAMSRVATSLVDGAGAKRVADALLTASRAA